ncbi:MAG TPA: radical SAM protein [Myxococcota bacterium]|nr:radical SAM protein [Myxococcota bacterium]
MISKSSDRDIHLGEPGFLHKLLRKRRLESVFLFVTARCNSKCRTCFYVGDKARGRDLTFSQIRTISETAPRFDKLWLSGGEPTLRKDLAEIIEMFYTNNGVRTINLPSNGLLTSRLVRLVEGLLERCPKLNMHLTLSVDGLAATHDGVRGVEGGFRKVMTTLQRLEDRFADHPRLHRNAASVVTPDAYTEMYDLGVLLLNKFSLATHFFETVRGDPRDPATKGLGKDDLKLLHDRLYPLLDPYAERLFAKFPAPARFLGKLYFIGVIRFLYSLQESNVDGPSPWPMDCTAGKTTIVIDHNGSFRSCEMREPVGRLQEFNFDLTAALNSERMQKEIEAIGGGRRANCWCTHTCWMLSSMQFSPSTLLLRVPIHYLAHIWKNGRGLSPGQIEAAATELDVRQA